MLATRRRPSGCSEDGDGRGGCAVNATLTDSTHGSDPTSSRAYERCRGASWDPQSGPNVVLCMVNRINCILLVLLHLRVQERTLAPLVQSPIGACSLLAASPQSC
jgi:hypothetical protein